MELDNGRLGHHHADYIEPNPIPFGPGFSTVLARDAQQMLALLLSDSSLRRPKISRFPRFNFNENQNLALPGNQIRLGVSRRQTIIARNDDESAFAQITMRQILASPPQRKRGRPLPSSRDMPQPIEKLQNHLIARSRHSITFPRTT